jgi:hypothetical protein
LRSRHNKKSGHNRAILIIPVIFTLSVLWVWKSTVALSLSKELTKLERDKTEIIEQNKHLRAELDKYHSIAWIDSCVRQYGWSYEVKQRMVLFDKPALKSEPNRNLFVSLADMIIREIKMVIE